MSIDTLRPDPSSAPDSTATDTPTPDTSGNMRILLEFARPHLPVLVLGLVFALGGSAAQLVTPLVTKWVLDSLGTDASLTGPVVALVALLIVGSVLGCAQWIILGTAAEEVVYDARTSLVRRLLRATVPAVQKRPAGELVTRVTSDTLLLREAASSAVVGIVNAAVLAVGTVILMGVLDLPLLGVTLVAFVIVGALFGVLMPRIAKAEARTQESLGRLGGLLEGSLRAVRTVKVARAEARVGGRVENEASEARTHAVTAVRVQAVAWTVAWAGVQGAIIAILAFGAFRVDQGLLQVSTLIAFLLYAFTLMGPVQELAQNVTALQSGFAAASRIRQLQSLPVEEDVVETAPLPAETGGPGLITLRAVTVVHDGTTTPALDCVDLTIPRRGHVAVVGPSGAGKTTLFSTILRFLEPRDGELSLNGVGYRHIGLDDLRGRMSYVEQETPVVPGTIRENVVFGAPDATDDEIRDVLRLLDLDGAVDRLPQGIDTPLTENSLSGGQRQRIAMARAMLTRSELLLLDEATAQVDTLTEAAIVAAVSERARTGVVVTIAHRLSTVRHADVIVVMEDGRVRASGSHDELLVTDELYRNMVRAGEFASAAD
ncbi:ATP-binding cassette, subfamily B [Rhodococcus triatomae]|uniref:ATP-binding cassette, subfamily B n=1 Tax=Rhodococcus triatomae TaxID=300028 RepID=A0A1G8Q0J5_9NOCA|nr:ABC transporter ATP-binding protein [Rhodococcus triatomae]SDI98217.1 ATP-binding cassette, subfamily B [Rhodococcus triatomae]